MLVVTTSHNNLSTRGNSSLDRMIASVRAARIQLERRRPARLAWSWVDDGSSDGTAEWLADRLRPADGELLTVNQTNGYAALARNQAAARLRSDIINVFDSDDEMLPDHLVVGHDALLARQADGRSFGCVSTLTDIGDGGDVLPLWRRRISIVNVNTTFYRRAVWDFVEGMPTPQVYRVVGGEDQDLIEIVQPFFQIGVVDVETARYWRYDGNAFDRQLAKFQGRAAAAEPEPAGRTQLNQACRAFVTRHIAYLKTKLLYMTDRSRFDGLVTGPAFVEAGLTY